jgi:hypothetical protein
MRKEGKSCRESLKEKDPMRTSDSRMSNSLAAKKHNADIPPGSNEILTIDLDD